MIPRPTQDRGERYATILIILDLIISFAGTVGAMPHILVRLPALEEVMMSVLRVVFAMPMSLVPMAIKRLQMSKPLLVNFLSIAALV